MTWDRWLAIAVVGWLQASLWFVFGWATGRRLLSITVWEASDRIQTEAEAGGVRAVEWCNLHDIPWASHADVGLSPAEFCQQGRRVVGPFRVPS